MILNKFIRVNDDDPNRCQAVHAAFQCPFRAVGDFDSENQRWIGPKYCPRHGGTMQATMAKREEKRLYLSAKWQEQIGEQVDHPKIKSLAEEIGIIRMTLQAKLNLIQDDKELVMHSSGIIGLVNSVKDLVKTWQHIQERSGEVLDRTTMNIFVQELLTILTRYIDDPEVLQMVGEDISGALDTLMKGK